MIKPGKRINLFTEKEIMNMRGVSIEKGTDVIDNPSWECGIGTRQRNNLGKYIFVKKDMYTYVEDLQGFYWPREVLHIKGK